MHNDDYYPLHPCVHLSFGTTYLWGVKHNQFFSDKPSCRPLFIHKEEAEQYKTWIQPQLNPQVVKCRVTIEEVDKND